MPRTIMVPVALSCDVVTVVALKFVVSGGVCLSGSDNKKPARGGFQSG